MKDRLESNQIDMTANERHAHPVRHAVPELWGIRRLLAVVAHPDDESFGLGGLLAALAAGGVHVDLLCLSHGEASTVGATDSLGGIRAKELLEAAAVLGLSQVWLEDLPDGHLSEHRERIAELVQAHLGDADAVVVFEPSGVTGHRDHQVATEVAAQAADRHGLVTIEWGVSPAIAAALGAELGAPLVGLDGPEVYLVHVDRNTQRAAVAHHVSQQPDNALLARRLQLQGDTERIQIRSAPYPTRLARFIATAGPLIAADAAFDDRQVVLDRLVAFAAGTTWPDGALEAGSPDGAYCLHEDPGGWSIASVVLDAGAATPVHHHQSWGAAATVTGVQLHRRFSDRRPDRLQPMDAQLVPRGSGYLFGPEDAHQAADATGQRSVAIHLMSRGGPDVPQLRPR